MSQRPKATAKKSPARSPGGSAGGAGGGVPARARAAVAYVHSDAQWEAVRSEVRAEMLLFLQSAGPCSMAELAMLMDRAPDGLYHHARALERAGLIHEVARRSGLRRPERVLDVVAERLRLDVDVASGRNIDRLAGLAQEAGDRARAYLDDALRAGDARLEELGRDALVRADAAWLDEADLDRLRHHLDAIERLMSAGRTRRRGRLIALTVVQSPIVRSRGPGARPTRRLGLLRAALERHDASS